MQKQWSCGCMEVDGQLVDECSQVKPAEPLQSHQRSVYSPVCYRKRETEPEAVTAIPVDVTKPTSTNSEATDGVQE